MLNKTQKGVYIVSETGCLNPDSGANKHIKAGLIQLKRYFPIELILFCRDYQTNNAKSKIGIQKNIKQKRSLYFNIRSGLKWLHLLLKNHWHFFSYLRIIKKHSPEFIYERACYLNYNGVLIARILGIAHIYEINGILFKDHERYFPPACNSIAYWLEKKVYEATTFGFYVGGINEFFKIPANKFLVIQNGIDQEFTTIFKSKCDKVGDKINITFIGHAMTHHRLDVLTAALKLLSNPSAFRLHLIGSNLESLKDKIPDTVETIFYGSLNHSQISELLKGFNVGIITFALPYFSHVKAFMYGAAKLTMIVPDSKNFKDIFSDEEVIFIKNADPKDMAEKLNHLAMDTSVLEQYGENIYNKVCNQFTWEKIYEDVANKIINILENHPR